ncbi:mitochondrial cytochrome b2 [Mollisia scopiformis]|uniref:L-lactate dehydrogenase (cytochrome) n=1 Tax=Mollisia scopiformis TaxID=149040 RepID=A0A194X541_MOLSC|nr:mitochondrial cytochrome b2 [Mollisia scopiformis]KUJ15189.1 mitochondrial cytochrome b2 [Mollisia scopiformis]
MSQKLIHPTEVAKHVTEDSCWVALYGDVYDVTAFLQEHPGGSRAILRLAGRDATADYDPIHPPGILEETMKPIGKLEVDTKASSLQQRNDIDPKVEEVVDLHDLLNLDEIEALATKKMSKKAWAYFYSAGDDLISKKLNNSVYRSILFRPRIFVDCRKCDTSTSLLGHRVGTPLYVSPTATARLAHPTGEKGIAEGISSFGALQIMSNYASLTPEQIVADSAPGQIFGWQLYVYKDRTRSEKEIAKINSMRNKIKFICLTLDSPVMGKREDDERHGNAILTREADVDPKSVKRKKVIINSFPGPALDLTWKSTLEWLSKHTDLPIVLKGLQTYEDAYLAMKCASVKAVVISNHGGRSLDTASPAVHTLLEIRKYCPEVFDRMEVWVDGGIKRGTDIVKALCLGAKAVGVGRATLFGLGAGGVAGVERVYEILQAEIETCMRLLGVENINQLGPQYINSRAVERDIFDGDSSVANLDSWVKSNL